MSIGRIDTSTTPWTRASYDPEMRPRRSPADEIRRGCPRRRVTRLLEESQGEEPVLLISRYVRCDDEGATAVSTVTMIANELA